MLYCPSDTKIYGENAEGRWDGDVLHIRFEACDWPMFTIEFPAIDMALAEGAELDVENTGACEAVIFGYAGSENPYCWSSGILRLAPGERGKLRIFIFQDKPPEVAKAFPHMMGVPGRSAHMEWPEAPKPAELNSLRIELEGAGSAVHLAVHGARRYGIRTPPSGKAAESLYPIMDQFGQYRHDEWQNKIHRHSDFAAHNDDEMREIAASPCAPERNKYGGWAGGPQFDATGHFYTKQVDGRWWFIDPDGRLYWAFGPSFVRPSCKAKTDGLEYLFEEIVPEGDYYKANLKRKFGESHWMEGFIDRAHDRMRHWGMNTFGTAADMDLCLTSRTPYCMHIYSLRFAARYGLGELDAAWKQRLEVNAAKVCEATADDPFCIGYFIDNEIHDKPDFGRWDYYYATCRDVQKKYAPNKLFLGSRQDWHRFPRGGVPVRIDHSDGPDAHDYSDTYKGYEAVLRAYAVHADVLAFNQYRYTYYNLRMPDYANKPILISETTVGALDRGMLHPSLRPTQSQEERAFACSHMLASALANPWIIGLHWFMYMDQPCTGWEHNGENFQMGIVDICDTPYPELLTSIKEAGYSMYSRRYGS
ncbi:MAG: hypothetical protein FWH01_11740 [Oscillospiraceae bacterium]|nr:hypothetical protein [Oscillospiraceae bacterium]